MANISLSIAGSQSVLVEGTAGIFDVPKKITVIRLRWLLIIICSYLLLSSEETWLSPNSIHGFILVYILTNVAFYFVEESLFDSPYLYSPLVLFDTLIVTASLVISGQGATDFYMAYFLIIIFSTIWQDFRGLVVSAVLAPIFYGFFLFQTTDVLAPSVYLRLPFLFVISLFYGYFVQIVRVEKGLKENAEQEAEDMAMVQTLSQALPSSLDYKQVIKTVREKIINVIQSAKIYIFIVDQSKNPSHAILFEGGDGDDRESKEVDLRQFPIIQDCIMKRSPVIQQRISTKFLSAETQEQVQDFSFPMSTAVPIAFRGELHGAILLGFSEGGRVLSTRETQFCQIVAFTTAIALSNAKKYEEVQTESKRRQIIAEQLSEANRLKSEYLNNTSHELRTPIATIMGYCSLLMEGPLGPLSEGQRKTLERLTGNARGLLGLVEELLDYSSLEKGETSLNVSQQEVRPLLDELRQELAPLERHKPYKVQYEVEEGIPPFKTDWGKLKRILVNILGNAIKFTDKGQVRLSVMNGTKGEVSFVISDTGIGIPNDQIRLIFDKLRQLDGSTTRHYEGVGLGLTVCKNLVELIGGKLEVESEVNKGSTFKVTIPVSGN